VEPEALYDENDNTVDGLAAESAERIDGGLAHRTMALAGNDLDPYGLAAHFGVNAKEFRSWIDLSSRLSLDDIAEAVGLSKEAIIGNAIPDIV